MSFDNVRVICGVVLAIAAVVYAAESDFVCDVVKNSNVICEDCLHPCTGCGITCNEDGSIVSVNWPHAGISMLPESIGKLRNLTYLNVYGNSLSTLPTAFESLDKLKTIILRDNEFDNFPGILLSLEDIDEVDLSNNPVKTVVLGLKTKVLSIQNTSFNDLTHLCSSIWITHLRLDRNDLSTLDCIAPFENLELLTLSHNKLSSLPNMSALVNLKELDLSFNSFTTFPEEVCAIPNLVRLNLAGNSISSIPDSCASVKISNLNLAKNEFSSFPNNLNQWTELRTLGLSMNSIKDVNLGEEEKFEVLNDLDLSFNSLSCEHAEEVFAGVNIVTCSQYTDYPSGSSSSLAPPSGSSTSPSESSTSHYTMPGWEIALIVVGSVVAVAVVVAIIVVFLIGRNRSRTGYVSIGRSQ